MARQSRPDGVIHFGSFDDRSCGARYPMRRITLDPNEVTCGDCKARDRFWLSASGRKAVAEFEANAERGTP